MLSDAHLAALGRLAVEAAGVEHMTKILANELIDEDPSVGDALIGGMQFAHVADRVQNLAPLRGITPSRLERVASAISGAKVAMLERNRLLHNHWVADFDGLENPVQFRRPHGKAESFHIEVSVEDLEDAAKSLKDARENLQIAWIGVVIDLLRTEDDPNEMRPGFTTVPNRWMIARPPRPPLSQSKTMEDRWVEGKITWDELQESNRAPDEPLPSG